MREGTSGTTSHDALLLLVLQKQHLDWSDKQRRILTDRGRSEQWYCSERGFAFATDELPHYYLQVPRQQQFQSSPTTTTREIFHHWKMKQHKEKEEAGRSSFENPIVGIWERTLFYSNGGSNNNHEFTTHHDEYTYNIQTSTLFIDLRIPKTRSVALSSFHGQSLNDMNREQLRYYAQQHIFAGYTKVQPQLPANCHNNSRYSNNHPNDFRGGSRSFPYCATRYHCIDWNYVGVPRSRPNKWYIELPDHDSNNHGSTSQKNSTGSHNHPHSTTITHKWKEWAYATNQYQQPYYCEYWERQQQKQQYDSHYHTNSDGKIDNYDTNYTKNNNNCESPRCYLILRKIFDPDGIIIILHDHIMYCIDRDPNILLANPATTATTLVEMVDELLLRQDDIDTARQYLSMQGGHGRFIAEHGSWILDHCIEFWKHGQSLFGEHKNNNYDDITILGTSIDDCRIQWQRQDHHQQPSDMELWSVFDTNLDSVDSIRKLLLNGPNNLHPPPPTPKKVAKLHSKL